MRNDAQEGRSLAKGFDYAAIARGRAVSAVTVVNGARRHTRPWNETLFPGAGLRPDHGYLTTSF